MAVGSSELIDIAHEALFAVTSDGVIVSWNQGAEAAYGFSPDEAIGHDLVELVVPEREVDITRELVASAARGSTVSARTTRRAKHGGLLHVDVTMTPTSDHRVAVSELDVTRGVERDRLETKLEEVRRLKSEFLSNMSHELRTPLNSIIGFAELMHKGKVGPMAPEHVEFLGDILTSAHRLLQLVTDVLDLAKLESGKIDFEPTTVDLAQAVTEIRDIMKGQINDKGHRVRIAIAPSAKTVVTDATRFKQVVYTLLSNAVKFTPHGGELAIRAQVISAHEWTLEVEDNGIGIADHDLTKLFVEFPRVAAGVAREGTGLGLALAQRIVEGQGGRLEASSTLGKGSKFTATFRIEVPDGG